MKFILRDYQKKLISDIHGSFSKGNSAVLGYSPTGSGKTVSFSYISDSLQKNNNVNCILVHRQELVTQTSMALSRFGVHHNIVAPNSVIKNCAVLQYREFGKQFFNPQAITMVASVQSLGRREDLKNAFDWIITDECHHAVAGQWRNITDNNIKAKLLGFSATPERLDGKGLGVEFGGVYQDLILGPSVQSLIDRGYLTKPRVFAPPIGFDTSGIKTIAGDYDIKEMANRLDKPKIIGDAVKHYSKICPNTPAVAFCSTIEHARHTAEQFCDAGFNFKCIDGTMSDVDRADAIQGLGSGKYDGLTSCNIISEGTDIPVIGAAIFLRKTKSLGLYLQQAGRALRPYPGKEYSIILDHVGNTEEHGFVEEERAWSLSGHSKKKANKDDLFIRTCSECYTCYKATLRTCPVCGSESHKKNAMEIEYIDAELVEYNKEIAMQKKKSERMQQGMAKSLQDLIKLGQQRGYSNPVAWAKKIHNVRRRRR